MLVGGVDVVVVVVTNGAADRGGGERRGKRTHNGRAAAAGAATCRTRLFKEPGAAGGRCIQALKGGRTGGLEGGHPDQLVAIGAGDELGAGGRGPAIPVAAQHKALHTGHDAGVGVN